MFEKVLAKRGNSLHWLMIFFVLQEIIGEFAVNQGYWQIDSALAVNFVNSAKRVLSLFICYRLIRPVGTQDIKALIILSLLPSSFFYSCFNNLITNTALITCRWYRYSRILAALLVALSCTIWSNWPTYIMGCKIPSGLTTTAGDFVSSTDGIYNLYKYPRHYQAKGYPYALFRELTLFPGVKLVKGLDACLSKGAVLVRRSEDGNYHIEGGFPFTKQ